VDEHKVLHTHITFHALGVIGGGMDRTSMHMTYIIIRVIYSFLGLKTIFSFHKIKAKLTSLKAHYMNAWLEC